MNVRSATVLLLVVLAGLGVVMWMLLAAIDPHAERDVRERETLPRDAGEPRLEGRTRPVGAEAPHEPGARVVGTVRDESGAPLADVLVHLMGYPSPPRATSERERHARRFAPRLAPRELDRTRTDAAGAFSFEVRAGDLDLEVGVAPSRGRVGTWAQVWTRAGSAARADLVLRSGSTLRLRVVDAAGQGLRAWVAAIASGFRAPEQPTDEEGRLEIVLPSGKSRLFLRVPGRGAVMGTAAHVPAADEQVVVFAPAGGARIEGRVTRTDGAPVAGADVTVVVYDADEGDRPTFAMPPGTYGHEVGMALTTATDADGRYTLAGLHAGTLATIDVEAAGFFPVRAHPEMDLPTGSIRNLDFVLEQGAILEGSVRSASGASLAGAQVVVQEVDGAFGAGAWIDGEGRYRFEALPAALEVDLSVEEDQGLLPLLTPLKVTLPAAGGAARADLVVAPGPTLRGRVVDGEARPVGGALVRVGRGGRAYSVRGHPEAISSDDGTFAFLDLTPRRWFTLQARTRTGRSPPVHVDAGRGDPAPVDLVLMKTARIEGQVVDPDGRGVATHVTCLSDDETRGGATVETDSEGGFLIEDLLPGGYTLSVGMQRASGARPLVLLPGESRSGIVLATEPLLAIEGQVVDPGGHPLAHVGVRAAGLRHEESGRSDADGAFTLRHLPPGTYEVRAEGGEPVAGVEAGARGVRLVVRPTPARRLAGRVLDPDGEPVPVAIARVSVSSMESERSEVRHGVLAISLRTNAQVALLYISQARDLHGRALPVRPHNQEVRLDGQPLEVRLRRGLRLTGRLVGPHGSGVGDVAVTALSQEPPGEWTVRTAGDGHFQFDTLGEGRVRLSFRPPAGWLPPDPREAQAGEPPLVVTLESARTLAGRVIAASGGGVVGARVVAEWAAAAPDGRVLSRTASTETTEGGRFVLEDLGAPPFRVTIGPTYGEEERWEHAPLVVEGVDPTAGDLVLRLSGGVAIDGTVVDDSGRPLEAAEVRALDRRSGSARSATTDASGRFAIRGLEAGPHRISVRREGYADVDRVEVSAPSREVRIAMRAVPRVHGELVGEDPERFEVTFTTLEDGRVRTTTGRVDAAGAFSFYASSLTPGILYAHSQEDDRYAILRAVRPGPASTRLVLVPGERLEGSIEVADEGRFSVYALTAEGLAVYGVVPGDGTFVVRGLPPGTCDLVVGWVRPGEYRSARLESVRTGTKFLVLRETDFR